MPLNTPNGKLNRCFFFVLFCFTVTTFSSNILPPTFVILGSITSHGHVLDSLKSYPDMTGEKLGFVI